MSFVSGNKFVIKIFGNCREKLVKSFCYSFCVSIWLFKFREVICLFNLLFTLVRDITAFRHCVKSVQIRSFSWSVFSCIWTKYGDLNRKSPYSARIQENTEQKKLRIWTIFTQCRFA